MANLPGAVHLVAHAPDLDAVGIFVTVCRPEVAPVGAGGIVAVLNEVARVLGGAGSHVHSAHNLGARLLRPVVKLIDADFVRLNRVPGAVKADGARSAGADSVLPVVAGEKVPARIAHEGNVQILHQVDDILPKALGIRRGVPRLVDAGIDGASQVLDE